MKNKLDIIKKEMGFDIEAEVEGKGSMVFIASTGNYDRVGDRIMSAGCKIKRPIKLLYGHNSKNISELLGTISNVWDEDNKLYMEAKFNSSPNGQLARQLVLNKELDEFSISMQPLDAELNDKSAYDFLSCDLLEVSLVANPCNTETEVLFAKSMEQEDIEEPVEETVEVAKSFSEIKDPKLSELELIGKLLRDNAEEIKQMVREKLSGRGNI
jgi:HK97 family phage prohead protease